MEYLILAISPCLAICLYVYWRDKHEKEPVALLLKAFIFGMLAVIPVFIIETGWQLIGIHEEAGHLTTVLFAFVAVGLTEEGAKYFFLRKYFLPNKEFNEPYDGIVYAVMVGMGFACVENVMYFYTYGNGVLFSRMLTAIPMHAACGVIMGYFLGLHKFQGQTSTYLWLALIIPTILHGSYDYFLFQKINEGMVFGALISLILSVRYAMKAIRLHQTASPFMGLNNS